MINTNPKNKPINIAKKPIFINIFFLFKLRIKRINKSKQKTNNSKVIYEENIYLITNHILSSKELFIISPQLF